MDTPRRTTSTTSTSQADSSPKSDPAVTTMTTTMSPLNLSPSPEQPFVTSTPVPRKQNSAPSELPAQQQQTLKPPSLRPKLNTILSSDASRFMSLEKLQQNMKNTNPHQERQLTIETAVFPEQQSIFNDKARRGAPQSDARSVRSANDANNHHKRSPSKRSNKRTSSKKRSAQSIKPAEIFARNLSDAVLDANDSDELESFVYRDNRSSLYPALPSFQWASESYVKRIDAGVESFNQHKPRRPVLRSAVSELPSTALLHSSPFHPKQQPKRYQDYYTSDADEESALLNPRGIRRKHYHHHHMAKKRKYILLWIVFALLVAITAMWSCILFTAMPLASFEATGLSNVLGSDKELFFDLHIRARNPNFWSVHVSHASLSVFASSHYVPTFPMDMDTNYTSFSKHMLASPIEFLGTISELDEPLIFEPANFFEPKVTNATTQIQIKYPGKSKDDMSGNERWARIIRYPYELTVRGVVKYHVLPLMQIHSARLCQMARVDPATGDISDLPPSERSVCDEEVMLPAAA